MLRRLMLLAALALAAPASAQVALKPLEKGSIAAEGGVNLNPIEKITLKPRRGPRLTQPGFEAGEYSGHSSARAMNRQFFGSKDAAKVELQVNAPGWSAPVTASCEGGQSKLVIAWITWKRETLAYNCSFSGGAPADAALTLALGEGSFLARLQQPLRAGEIVWNGMTIRFDTRQVGSMPISGGRPLGYVFSRDGREIGGVDLGGGFTPPSFFLPSQGSPERDAVMVAALSLFFFPDPGNR